jgi:hypothetical protein
MECKEVLSARINCLCYTAIYLCLYACVQYRWPNRFRQFVGGEYVDGFVYGITVGVSVFSLYVAYILKEDSKRF